MSKQEAHEMKKVLKILIPLIIIAAIIGGVVFYNYSNRTRWNDSYINGNTAGNLYNNGLFCEHNGTVYFSNPNDNHYLYSMNTSGGEVKKLYEDIASFINADDHYVYYVRNNVGADTQFSFLHVNTNSLCRYDLRTGKVTVLDTEPCIYASLIKIDGTEQEQVDTNPYFTCSANGQYLYYNGIESDHNIYQYDTTASISQAIVLGNFWMPSADNENIYYLDCENNYSLIRLARSQAPVQLVSDRVEYYNVYGDTVYFQRNNLAEDAALCSVKTDGSDYRVIAEGNYTNINAASQYLYFSEVGSENVIYQMPLNGNGEISIFSP